jgi:hypothetical protein
MARQRDVSEIGPLIVSEPSFLRKTHLTWAGAALKRSPHRRYLYL